MVWLRLFFLVQKIIALGISGKDIRINYQNKKSSFTGRNLETWLEIWEDFKDCETLAIFNEAN